MEVESGRKDDRPQLAAALVLCRRKLGRVLVIAKLDRLARSVTFISNLMESGVAFVAVDMPHANKLTMHVLAAVAEHEREMISQRTKAALGAAKARGTRLGNPRPNTARMRAAVAERVASFRARALPTIQALAADGRSLREIAAELNTKGITAPRGGMWYAASVRSIIGSS